MKRNNRLLITSLKISCQKFSLFCNSNTTDISYHSNPKTLVILYGSVNSKHIHPPHPTQSICLGISHFVLEQLQIPHGGDRRFRQKPHGGAQKRCANAIVNSAIHNLTKNILLSNINITISVLKISFTLQLHIYTTFWNSCWQRFF